MTTEGKVFAILLMQFNLSPIPALKAVDAWLKEHPQKNLDTLNELLQQKKITMVNGKLTAITQRSVPNPGNVVTQSQGEQTIHYAQPRQPLPPRVKTFRFRGVTYHKVEASPIQQVTTIEPTVPPQISQPNPTNKISRCDPHVVNFQEYTERKKRSQQHG